jgi:uncharacterized protein
MILIDVNVLLYAHRDDAPDHSRFRAWLESVVSGDASFGMSDLVLSGFLRVATHRRVFNPPTPVSDALAFANAIREAPNRIPIEPGPRHWAIFAGLVRAAQAKGGLVPDAYFAALAIETNSEWITTDRDFARFEGLRWRHPLES